MSSNSDAKRVQRTRDRMRAQGLRPVQIWVPDTMAVGFADEYRRQCRLVNESSTPDPDMAAWDAWIDVGNCEADEGLDQVERRP